MPMKTYKILLVEDDKIDQLAFKRLIKEEDLPYEYTLAGSTAQAKSYLNEEAYDIVITDYSLGDGTGFDLFHLVGSAPIVFVTGGGDEETAVRAMKEGAYDYLIKDMERNYLKVLPVTIENAIKHKQAEERYTLLSHAVMSTNDSVFVSDMNGKIIFVNKAFCDTYGYDEEDILDRSIEILWKNESDLNMSGTQKIESGWSGEVIHNRKDATPIPVLLSESIIKDIHGNAVAVVGVARDITIRKQTEEALRQAKEEAENVNAKLKKAMEGANKAMLQAEMANRAKSEFLANMSHEIRTPLNGIIGMTELTLETDLSASQREYLDAVKFSADTLLTVVNDILDFSKIEAGKLEIEQIHFDLSECIKEAALPISIRAEEKALQLNWFIHPEMPLKVIGDPTRLKQIIINLLGNAVKFTEKGGIHLNTDYESISKDEMLLRITVCDTGVGIPSDKQQKIFNAFTQADGSTTRKYGGTGLGLAICSRLVKMMGGQIYIESPLKERWTDEGGPGSVFQFTVRLGLQYISEESEPFKHQSVRDSEDEPIQEMNTADVMEKTPDVSIVGEAGRLRILLAEDNTINLKLAEFLLKKKGWEVTAVCNGKAAIEAVENQIYDLVLMDIQMPEMDGIEAVQTIRSREKKTGRHIPIIALTAHAMNEDKVKCLQAGMDDYVSKPMKAEVLYNAIQRMMAAYSLPTNSKH